MPDGPSPSPPPSAERAHAYEGEPHMHRGEPHEHEAAHGHGHGDGHTHGGVDAGLLGSREAMRTLALSLAILGVTAALQVVVVVLSGSIALLADTIHNVGDALTAIPLAVAFTLARRPPTPRLTYGYGRAEDFAGIAVVLTILVSAIVAAYEAIDRLVNPHTPGHLLITALAGVIGFAGNELVAVYRIRSGRRIGSAALEADGHHARIDGFTSLAVVAGVIGVALGAPIADPIVGLLISLAIVRIVWQSAREIGLRALDGIDPVVVDQIREQAAATPGVQDVQDVRARWLGHVIRAELAIEVPPGDSAREAAATAQAVRERLTERVAHVADATVAVRAGGADRSSAR
ncbi:MAG: putative Co/Zn/Cd cation efflux system protein [Conexibacter sp.]|nr:putative Co/Zn/Cd cation efflux system protein [Conexibacter sp.]